MLAPVKPVLHAAPLDPRAPTDAVERVVAAGLCHAPSRRAMTVYWTTSRSPRGLMISPWIDRGIARAVESRGGRIGRSIVAHHHGAPAPTRCSLETLGRVTARIPASWFGTNLVLVAPLVHRHTRRRGFVAPIEGALFELARELGCGDDPASAWRACQDVFAHVTVLVDATWWTVVGRHGHGGPRVCVGHCLAMQNPSLAALRSIDHWLERQLSLGSRRDDAQALLIEGELGAWPQVRWPRRLEQLSRYRPVGKHRGRRRSLRLGPFTAAWISAHPGTDRR